MKIANCKNCNKEFEYRWSGRGNSCSLKCTAAIVAKSKLKYSEEQINKVIELKKAGLFNTKIVKITGVKISKVKEIVKSNNLFLAKDELQKRAYTSKLAKNPEAMLNMRAAYRDKSTSSAALEEIKEVILSYGYEYLEGFKGKSKPFKIRCLRCKTIRETSKINTVLKDTCAKCSGVFKTSAAEIEIAEWLQSMNMIVEKYKFAERAGGIEIDVYMPEIKVGIEYCGLYWHNEESPTPRTTNYHANKAAKANRDGIRLITIFQDEWRDRKEQIKGFLKSVIGKNENKLFARKTHIKSILKEEVKIFMNANHIQGFARAEAAFGLFFEGELVAAITGNIHHRAGQDGVYVLNRLVFKNNHSVAGGASKLTKTLLAHAKSLGFKKMVSWSDNRWSEGRVYQEIGFGLEQVLKPDYSYVSGQNRLSKQSCQKKFLSSKGAEGNTESKMASSLGYKKIWDCGKKRWALEIK